jgi:hypothetical protein
MSKYWFKPKSHGYGASPDTWEGWIATAIAGLAPGALAWILLGGRAGPQATSVGTLPLVIWLVATLAIFIGFYKLARRKTDGEWRWRWKRPPGAEDGGQEPMGRETIGKR